MDHEDSYPPQSLRHLRSAPQTHWDGRCSCGSLCSLSSEDLSKSLPGSTKAELYPPADARRDYSPPAVKLLRPSGTTVGREAALDDSRKGRELEVEGCVIGPQLSILRRKREKITMKNKIDKLTVVSVAHK